MREIMTLLKIRVNSYERSKDPIYIKNIPLGSDEENTCNRVKLEQIEMDQMDADKIALSPGWFGKGIRKKWKSCNLQLVK